jgi:integrase
MKAPKVTRKEAVFLDDKQTAEVIKLLQNEPIKWRTVVTLLIYSGMRRGELIALEWNDFDFEHQVVHIRRSSQYVSSLGVITKDTKNASSERTIKLPDSAFRMLKEYKNYCDELKEKVGDYWHDTITLTYANGKKEVVNNDRLFTGDNGLPMNPDSITSWIHKFVEKNNLPKFSTHSLRHTNASLLIANGVNIPTVSKRLGHASISTTTKIYSHAIQSADEKASEILSEKLDPPQPQIIRTFQLC